ncbi:M1 family aminopeptidase [Leeia sp.]|uniref:M1 family aminopeptidase n=1 Tax=Leeia sp. TaxID=2884678 RepID=UPI0035ADBDA9
MKLHHRITMPGFALAALLGAPPLQAQTDSTRYDIEATVDYKAATVTVKENVHYTNRTKQPLSTVAFTVVAAAEPYRAFKLSEARVNGQTSRATLGKGQQDGGLDVALPKALKPGESVEVQLNYALALQDKVDLRLGRNQHILHLGNWLPTVKHATETGWPQDRYIDTGDAFFMEASDYQIKLTVNHTSSALKVASSGMQSARTEQGSSVNLTLQGKRMREFAILMSEDYQVSSRKLGPTTIFSYYLPQQKAEAEEVLKTTVDALAWGNAHLGAYPYPVLTIAEGWDPEGGGQEYSSLFVIASGDYSLKDLQYFKYLIAHETYHMWFYWLVGNDQINEAWLDESLATYMGYQYVKSIMPGPFPAIWQKKVNDYFEEGRKQYGYLPLDSTLYAYKDDEHSYSVLYRQGALFHDELKQQMGEQAYYAAIKRHVAAQSGQISHTLPFLRQVIRDLPGTRASKQAFIRKYFSAKVTEAAFAP